MPTIVPVMQVVSVAATSAFGPSWTTSADFSGAIVPSAPIRIATLPRLPKLQSAKVTISRPLGLSVPGSSASSWL